MTFTLPEWIKIPLEIFLPAAFLITTALLFLPNSWLEALRVLEFREQWGYIIGLVFLSVSCLSLVYLSFYLYYKLTCKQRMWKRFLSLNAYEKDIIMLLYKSPYYTALLDFNNPIIQGLQARHYIYSGNQCGVMNSFDCSINMYFTLQPIVCQTLDHYYSELEQ